MPEVPQWARVRGDVNFGARRGAWHEVVHLTTEAAVIQIGQRSVSIPRDSVQIVPVRPQRWCFPARNRIMAALTAMTVVVEGGDHSGSLITARFAAELGRDVGAVPGHVTSALARGPNQLLAGPDGDTKGFFNELAALCVARPAAQ